MYQLLREEARQAGTPNGARCWWLRNSKRLIEERRAVPTLLARADEVIE
jgi:hypothetical protein